MPSPEKRTPWEFRINKMETETLTDRSGDYKERYNYWIIEGDRLEVGFHGKDETTSTDVGELLTSGKDRYVLLVSSELKPDVRLRVLPKVLASMKAKGLHVQTMESTAPRMAA
jgi:hypothetical protein